MKKPIPDKKEFEEYYKEHSLKETSIYFGVSTTLTKKWRNFFSLPFKKCRHKQLGSLTTRQIEILKGSLLGDGHLSMTRGGQNSRFVENHCLKQLDYLEWKHSQFQPFSLAIRHELTKGRKRLANGVVINDPTKEYKKVTFRTITHPELTVIEQNWYTTKKCLRKKCLPENLTITSLSLAVWYFDDGHNDNKSRNAYLSVYSWSKVECYALMEQIHNLGIQCNSHPVGKKPQKIFIKSCSYDMFLDMALSQIPPHILPYKTKRKV